jgi:hypothetical protein
MPKFSFGGNLLRVNGGRTITSSIFPKGSAAIKIFQSRSDQNIFTLMGKYKVLSSIEAHSGQDMVTVLELAHFSHQVWRYQRKRMDLKPIETWSGWFVGYVSKFLLNKMCNEGPTSIVSIFLIYASGAYAPCKDVTSLAILGEKVTWLPHALVIFDEHNARWESFLDLLQEVNKPFTMFPCSS